MLTAHLLGRDEPFGGYHGLAWATFTDPEVGRVGMTEQQARDAGLRVRIGSSRSRRTPAAGSTAPGNDGFVKVVEDADRGVLVGATVVGPYGGEMLGLLTLAVHAAGAGRHARDHALRLSRPCTARVLGGASQAALA